MRACAASQCECPRSRCSFCPAFAHVLAVLVAALELPLAPLLSSLSPHSSTKFCATLVGSLPSADPQRQTARATRQSANKQKVTDTRECSSIQPLSRESRWETRPKTVVFFEVCTTERQVMTQERTVCKCGGCCGCLSVLHCAGSALAGEDTVSDSQCPQRVSQSRTAVATRVPGANSSPCVGTDFDV